MKHYHDEIKKVTDSVDAFFKRALRRIELSGPSLDPVDIARGPVMVVCTHRSQADYFIAGHVLHRMDLANLRFAAGENLTSLPVIGKRFQQFGAFTVRRGTTFGREYVRSLTEQVVGMLSGGDSVVVFPEGGRSYEGVMMEIRGGIIGAAVLAQRRNPTRPVRLLPMSISYEELPELRYFDMLLKGKHLRRGKAGAIERALGSLLYYGADAVAFAKFIALTRLGVKYGSAFIDHGPLIPISEYTNLEADAVADARDDFSSCRLSIQKVCLSVHRQFLTLYRILPQHILARVIRDDPSVNRATAAQRCLELCGELRRLGRNMASVGTLSAQEIEHTGREELCAHRALSRRGDGYTITNPRTLRYCAATAD